MRHHRVKKSDDVDAFLQHTRSELLRLRCVADHYRDDRVNAGFDRQAALRQRGAEELCVFLELVAQFGRRTQKLQCFQRGSDNRRRDSVGKQIRPRTLPQKIDDLLAPAGEPAAGTAQGFAECAGDNIDPAHHAAIFVRAAPGLAEKTSRVRVVDHRHCAIFFREITNRGQIRDRAVHRKTTISGNQFEARILRGAKLRFEVVHVVVFVTKALRLAEANAVDDARVIQFITDHRVLFREQCLEQPAVSVEAGWIKERFFRAEKFGERRLQFLVNVLCAADETHTGHAEAMRVQCFFCRSNERRMIGQAEIIVSAHVQYAFPSGNANMRILRCGNHTLVFVSSGGADFLQLRVGVRQR